MRLSNITLTALLLFSTYTFAQHTYNVEFNELKGSLKSSDKYKKDFGRYHGFELPLYEGEKANFAVFSKDFNAKLILVDPKGQVYKQSAEASKGMTSILTEIPMSGEWVLYIVGGINDTGEFSLRYAFAASNSTNISHNMDFCSSLNFLIAHASARFMMLPFEQLERSGMELIGREGKVIIDEKDGALNIILYEGADENGARMSFSRALQGIENCIGDWKATDTNAIGKDTTENITSKIFTEKGNKNGITVLIEMISSSDLTDSKKKAYRTLMILK